MIVENMRSKSTSITSSADFKSAKMKNIMKYKITNMVKMSKKNLMALAISRIIFISNMILGEKRRCYTPFHMILNSAKANKCFIIG